MVRGTSYGVPGTVPGTVPSIRYRIPCTIYRGGSYLALEAPTREPLHHVPERREPRRQGHELLHLGVLAEPVHVVPHRGILLRQRGSAVGHQPCRRVDVHRLELLERDVEPLRRRLQPASLDFEPDEQRLEQLAALEPPVGTRTQHALRR